MGETELGQCEAKDCTTSGQFKHSEEEEEEEEASPQAALRLRLFYHPDQCCPLVAR